MAETTILRTRREIEDEEAPSPTSPVNTGSPPAFAPAPEPVANNPSVTFGSFFGKAASDPINPDANVNFVPSGTPVQESSTIIHHRAEAARDEDPGLVTAGGVDVNVTGHGAPISNNPDTVFHPSAAADRGGVLNVGNSDVKFSNPQAIQVNNDVNITRSGDMTRQACQAEVSFLGRGMLAVGNSDVQRAACGDPTKLANREDISFAGKGSLNVGGVEAVQAPSGDMTKRANEEHALFGGQGAMSVGGTEIHQVASGNQVRSIYQDNATFGGQGAVNVGGTEISQMASGDQTRAAHHDGVIFGGVGAAINVGSADVRHASAGDQNHAANQEHATLMTLPEPEPDPTPTPPQPAPASPLDMWQRLRGGR